MSRASTVRLATLALLWGSSFLFIKVSLDGLSPIQIVLARMCTGALVLLALLALRGTDRLPREPGIWAHIVVAAVLANIVPYFLFAWGEERVDSAVAGTLNATTPLFAMALAVTTRADTMLSALRTLGLLLGFLGALLIIAPWDADLSGSATGAAACLAAALSYGISYVYMHRYLVGRQLSPLTLATVQISVGAGILVAAAPFVARQAVHLTPSVLASILALGALGTGVAYVLNYRLIQDEGATAASTVTYLLPIVAVVLGAIVLSEPITWNLFAGTVLVLAGIALSNRPPTRPAASTVARAPTA